MDLEHAACDAKHLKNLWNEFYFNQAMCTHPADQSVDHADIWATHNYCRAF